MLDRTIAPPSGAFRPPHLPAYSRHQLSNGLEVYLLPFGQDEVLQLEWISRAGNAFLQQAGLANYSLANLQEGTDKRSAKQIAQELDQYGAWIGHDVGDEVVSLQLSMLSKQFAQIVPLFRDLLCEPSFPEENFVQMKARAQQNLLTASQKTSFQARRRFGHLLYGQGHPYGRHLGVPELEALSLVDIRTYHQHYLVPANTVLAICGRFETEAILSVLEEQLGTIPSGNAPLLTDYAEQAPQNQLTTELIERKGPQSTIRMGHLSLSRHDDDYVGMRVLMSLLGGFFGSRLMKKIREEKGYTYGVYAALSGRPRYGQIVIQTDVANTYVEETRQLILDEMKRLQDHAPEEEELRLVKNYMLGQSLNQRETAFQLGGILRYHIASGIDFTEMEQRFLQIEALTPAKIRDLAQKWLRPEQMLSIICGGTK